MTWSYLFLTAVSASLSLHKVVINSFQMSTASAILHLSLCALSKATAIGSSHASRSSADHFRVKLDTFSLTLTSICSLSTSHLFRQNTYLQNKKHMLTCKGGTGCYRFNYQPGS